MKIYEFGYTSCIHESAMAAISLHKTKKGAEMALGFHKAEAKKDWIDMFPTKYDQKQYPFGDSERWDVFERDLLE